MKILKWLGIIVGVIVVILLIVAALLPGEYRIERSIVIEIPIGPVYEQVVDLRNWDNWSPWKAKEPNAEYTVSGTERGVGAVASWKGEILGEGSLTIMETEEPTLVKSRLVFVEPWNSESDDIWTFAPGAGGTEVTWAEEGELSYPIERFFGLSMEGMLGPDMEAGLEKLKSYLESLPEDSPELIDGALSEDDSAKARKPDEMTGDPDKRYEVKPLPDARPKGDTVRKPLPKAKRIDPPR